MSVKCPYCGEYAQLQPDSKVYGKSYGGQVWLCGPCFAYVGTHKSGKGTKPLGTLANQELRKWRSKAHISFDPLWQSKIKKDPSKKRSARNEAYSWLAMNMGLDIDDCHIGMFDVEKCKQAILICRKYTRI